MFILEGRCEGVSPVCHDPDFDPAEGPSSDGFDSVDACSNQGWASPSHDSDSSHIFLMTRTRLGLGNWVMMTRLCDSSHSLEKNFHLLL